MKIFTRGCRVCVCSLLFVRNLHFPISWPIRRMKHPDKWTFTAPSIVHCIGSGCLRDCRLEMRSLRAAHWNMAGNTAGFSDTAATFTSTPPCCLFTFFFMHIFHLFCITTGPGTFHLETNQKATHGLLNESTNGERPKLNTGTLSDCITITQEQTLSPLGFCGAILSVQSLLFRRYGRILPAGVLVVVVMSCTLDSPSPTSITKRDPCFLRWFPRAR